MLNIDIRCIRKRKRCILWIDCYYDCKDL